MKSATFRRGMLAASLALVLSLPLADSAQARIGAFDQVPSATLLLPYFEVDLANENGAQTRFSVINTAADPTLAKVTLWSNLGVPTFNFDVYLEGRDTVEVDLRLLFKGVLPQTGPGQVTLGANSNASVNFTGCTAGTNTALGVSLPIPDLLSASQIDHLTRAHSGQTSPSLSNQCAGINLGDSIARGYVTIDVVNQCSTSFPTEAGYFLSGGTGIAGNDNVLTGSFTVTERNLQSNSAVSPLVHLEADGTDPLTSTAGNYTFYSAYVAATAADNREPAGSIWTARQMRAGLFDADTEFVVWRDPAGRNPVPFGSGSCSSVPPPFPLDQTQIAMFDEQEEAIGLNTENNFPNPPPPRVVPFPFAAQKVNGQTFSPFESGVSHLNLNYVGTPWGTNNPGVRQSVVLVRHRMGNQYSPFLPATWMIGPLQQPDPNSCSDGCNSFSGMLPL